MKARGLNEQQLQKMKPPFRPADLGNPQDGPPIQIDIYTGGKVRWADVKVPKGNLVGKLNGGWEIAKRLLQYERQNISSGGFGGAGGYDLPDAAKEYVGVENGKIADPDLRARVAAHQMDAQAFALTVRRIQEESKTAKGPSAATSTAGSCRICKSWYRPRGRRSRATT